MEHNTEITVRRVGLRWESEVQLGRIVYGFVRWTPWAARRAAEQFLNHPRSS